MHMFSKCLPLVCIHARMCWCMHANVRARMYVYMHACIYGCVWECMYLSMYLCMYPCMHIPASRRRAPAWLRRPEPRLWLSVCGVPKSTLRTHSSQRAPLWGGLVTCRASFAYAPVLGLCFFVHHSRISSLCVCAHVPFVYALSVNMFSTHSRPLLTGRATDGQGPSTGVSPPMQWSSYL